MLHTRYIGALFVSALIFFLPLGMRKLLWQADSVFIEYEAVFWYLTDFFTFGLIAWWLGATRREPKLSRPRIAFFLAAGIFGATAFSLFVAKNIFVGVWGLGKLGEMLLLFFAARYSMRRLSFRWIAWIFVAAAVMQSVWSVGQFMTQHDFGLQILGESPLDPSLPGVAKLEVEGVKIIRAYGSFPHPNILAAFLLSGLFFLSYLILRREGRVNFWWTSWPRFWSDLVLGISFLAISLGLLLTFSRSAWLVGLALWPIFLCIVWLKKASMRWEVAHLVSFGLILGVLFSISVWPYIESRAVLAIDEQAVADRLFYLEAADSMITSSPWLGVGIGNFVSSLREAYPHLPSWQFQPVHNLYILIASEIGFFGLAAFLFFLTMILRDTFKRIAGMFELRHLVILFLISSLLLLGLFDHYFWTIQQGRLLFWLALALL